MEANNSHPRNRRDSVDQSFIILIITLNFPWSRDSIILSVDKTHSFSSHPGIFVSKSCTNEYPRAGREKARGGWPYSFSWHDVYDAYFGWCSIAFTPVRDLREDDKNSFPITYDTPYIYYAVMEIRCITPHLVHMVAQVGG